MTSGEEEVEEELPATGRKVWPCRRRRRRGRARAALGVFGSVKQMLRKRTSQRTHSRAQVMSTATMATAGGRRSFRVEALSHVQGRVEDGDGRRREEGGKLGFCGAAAGRLNS